MEPPLFSACCCTVALTSTEPDPDSPVLTAYCLVASCWCHQLSAAKSYCQRRLLYLAASALAMSSKLVQRAAAEQACREPQIQRCACPASSMENSSCSKVPAYYDSQLSVHIVLKKHIQKSLATVAGEHHDRPTVLVQYMAQLCKDCSDHFTMICRISFAKSSTPGRTENVSCSHMLH